MAGGQFQRRGGLRGGQTATRAVSPDVAIVLDTACWAKNFNYGAANHRQIGNGPMLVLSDKSLIAPPKLTAWIETVAAEIGVPLQADMFSNGGTDGGAVHLTGTGVPTVVMGLPPATDIAPRRLPIAVTFCRWSNFYLPLFNVLRVRRLFN